MVAHPLPTILFVDDEPANRKSLACVFRQEGFEVREAATGQEALRLAAEQPDVIILDVNLPDMSGFDVCRRIKAHPATTSIPVVHISAQFIHGVDRVRGLNGGAESCLIKPVEPQEILAEVKTLLRVHQAEEEARAQARQWQTTFDALSDAVCLVSPAGLVLRGNRALADLLDRPLADILGQSLAQLVRDVFGPVLDPLLSDQGLALGRQEAELLLKGRWFRVTMDPVVEERQSMGGRVVLLADVTEGKLATLERSRLFRERAQLADHLRLLLESTAEGIFGVDLEGRCTFINRAGAAMFGYTPEAVVGQSAHALIHHSHADRSPYPKDQCPIHQTLRTGRGCRVDHEVLWRHDGTSFPAEYSSYPVHEEGVIRGAVIIVQDSTERRRLEDRLIRSQKLEALGKLAGAVAHDFNNLLTPITAGLSVLLTGRSKEDPDHELLATMETASWRAAELVHQLLSFSRQTHLTLRPVNLNEAIKETVGLLRRTLDPRITIETAGDPNLWPVRADPGRINQVLLNLCLNARDAMGEGGRLRLETVNVNLTEADVRTRLEARAGAFVRLRVSDTGQGIPAEILPQIFEPFFTTKGPGQGTGLGLAVVFGIIQQHGGWIECDSVLGQGTRFDLFLPRWSVTLLPAQTSPPPPAQGGHETILVVDDDALVRSLSRNILEAYGYRVLVAEDGLEGLEIYQRQPEGIDLVVLDMTMPRLSGRDTLDRLRQINPGVRVLLASGYPGAEKGEVGAAEAAGFISKPYRAQHLARMVRLVLDQALVRS
jgi:PAS domain S-box-containing protein